MTGIILIGILSGMVFGTLAMLLPRLAVGVILLPIVLAPVGYLIVWRDALIGPCFFASNFNTDQCAPFRTFIGLTLDHAGDAIVITATHLVLAFVTFMALSVARKTIARVDLSSPEEKEAKRKAEEHVRQAHAELKQKMEDDLAAATAALHASRQSRAASS
ncbi:MAG: hypothetical protein AB8B88_07305 [Devosiaceae bacterium]